jgi:hypothetical protein
MNIERLEAIKLHKNGMGVDKIDQLIVNYRSYLKSKKRISNCIFMRLI